MALRKCPWSPEAVLVWDKAVIWSGGFNAEEMLHEPEVSWHRQKRSRVPDSRFGTRPPAKTS